MYSNGTTPRRDYSGRKKVSAIDRLVRLFANVEASADLANEKVAETSGSNLLALPLGHECHTIPGRADRVRPDPYSGVLLRDDGKTDQSVKAIEGDRP